MMFGIPIVPIHIRHETIGLYYKILQDCYDDKPKNIILCHECFSSPVIDIMGKFVMDRLYCDIVFPWIQSVCLNRILGYCVTWCKF
jgi:hypothetical protein